ALGGDDEFVAAVLDQHFAADREPQPVDARDRSQVGDFAPVDHRAFARFQFDVAVGLEARGGGDADQQHGDADVDDVAAVAAPVAADDPGQRFAHRLTGQPFAPGGA